jgi:hypothetical protein
VKRSGQCEAVSTYNNQKSFLWRGPRRLLLRLPRGRGAADQLQPQSGPQLTAAEAMPASRGVAAICMGYPRTERSGAGLSTLFVTRRDLPLQFMSHGEHRTFNPDLAPHAVASPCVAKRPGPTRAKASTVATCMPADVMMKHDAMVGGRR